MKTTVVNLFGGPGVGKSTVATGLFSLLKQKGISAEYVSEYAKDLTWEGLQVRLDNQLHVFAEQFTRQYRLLNKVKFVITDSPLLLSCIYADHVAKKELAIYTPDYIGITKKFYVETFRQFDNLNFILDRKKTYDPVGRNQTLDEAKVIDKEIKDLVWMVDPFSYVCYENEAKNIQNIYHQLKEI